MSGNDLTFRKKNKLYVADMPAWIARSKNLQAALQPLALSTVKEECLTSQGKRTVVKAREFVRKVGYPSEGEALRMVRDGNINSLPFEAEDIKHAFVLGEHVAAIKGKLTNRKAKWLTKVDPDLLCSRKTQTCVSDVMHMDNNTFLVSVCIPLELTLISYLPDLKETSLGKGLQAQFNVLQSRGFTCNVVITDPQRGLVVLVGKFHGVLINISGAGDHLPKVYIKIQRIKETCRSVKHGLAYKLPAFLVKDLVAYSGIRLNVRRTKALGNNVCARIRFTGQCINYKREFALGFGDYVEAKDPKAVSNGSDEHAQSSSLCTRQPTLSDHGSCLTLKLRRGLGEVDLNY